MLKGWSNFGPQLGTAKVEVQEIFFDPILGPLLAAEGLEIRLGPAKSRSRACFFGSKGLQERSKRPKGGLQQQPRAEDAI